MAVSTQVHYASVGIVDRILAAIPYSPDDGVKLAPTQLFPFDQLHGRELLATREHTARLNAAAGQHVLDIGSGIGGPARYIASTYGNNVTGVDLTADFVAYGTPMGTLSGAPLYAYLIDSTNTVVRRVIVNSANGTYLFPDADMFTNYTLQVKRYQCKPGRSASRQCRYFVGGWQLGSNR